VYNQTFQNVVYYLLTFNIKIGVGMLQVWRKLLPQKTNFADSPNLGTNLKPNRICNDESQSISKYKIVMCSNTIGLLRRELNFKIEWRLYY